MTTRSAPPEIDDHVKTRRQQTEVQSGRPLSEEESFYHATAFKEPVESVKRIEETAKFLAGAVATTSGLFVAALKLSADSDAIPKLLWLVPFLLWWISLLSLLVVFLPRKYPTGHNEPASCKEAFLQARDRKFFWLIAGAVCFIAGLAAAVLPLILFTG